MNDLTHNETTTPTEQVADRPVVRPAVDVFENQDEILLVADLPGVTSESLSVDLEDDRLTIHGRRAKGPGDDARLLMGTDTAWDYRRAFTVPDAVDVEKIKANLEDGVLTLHLPRHERTKPRRIHVKA
ncbi:MAG: Hsp20/alpha crystallin family protein [Myxococcales bacterium]|nr:Hsp20/alpha crystallin family protein [Myxococcales bacterium]MCB9731059.1 Hsp20/alpha crystallin family protein [Deltaproteobacteria bacterium]